MRTGWRREIVGTWGWPRVSFHGGPLQTQTHGQRSKPTDTALPVSAPPSSQVKVPELSLAHPRASHCGPGKCTWHQWG